MKTQVLIIGGGFGGVTVAQKLQKNGIKTTLVDRKDYFEVTYAVLREVADPDKAKGLARRYYRDILAGSFVQSAVQVLRDNTALLENGEIISFEQVVIATGSKYPTLPLAKSIDASTLRDREGELKRHYDKLKSASEVLIIGGGVVGVELAGEIAYAIEGVNVTLVHKGHAVLDGFSEKAQRKAHQQLANLGVHIKLKSNYQQSGNSYKDERSGHEITPDVVYMATGTKPNNAFLQPHFKHLLNDKGLVVVNERLEVVGQDNFYALGDIAEVGEAKLGYLAVEQGKYLAKAIVNKRQRQPSKAYKRNAFMALVPTGQETGVVQLPIFTSTCKHLVNLKQKDLFIGKTYKEFMK
ncbi:NAD(P)/FAD-dependent oxidoreductase [Pseudoalteromonas luteoviolacea]|uniref:NAD(P)/FAD-dependent oxidoreductase n=1 Tax=Pseudoalteromonas luteoviolacea TaxID=43657 RepID=UPI001B3946E5|nr:FAD-dependent oxidoreductase [Pseudoalteromonas luteoviolacea]MBQ4838098.1 FAD-dependent oxidoreductase [Pseudoalteromonas luteoviolacea]